LLLSAVLRAPWGALLLSAGACYDSIDRYRLPPGAQEQARQRPLLLSNDGTDGRTDGQADGRLTVDLCGQCQ